jgi:hypothetical protein
VTLEFETDVVYDPAAVRARIADLEQRANTEQAVIDAFREAADNRQRGATQARHEAAQLRARLRADGLED